MGPRRTLAGALAVPLLLLAACGGGDTSIADPPISPGSTTSSPADRPQRESPEHFIRRWADAEKRMENTGKTAEYAALSRGCIPCESLIKDVTKFYAAGGFIRWNGLSVLSVEKTGPRNGGATGYEVRTNSTPTHYKKRAGGRLTTLKGGVTTELLSLKRIDGDWTLVARARVSK